MISYLKGKVILKREDFLILDVNGIGYKVFLPGDSLRKIKKSSVLTLFSRLYLRKDTIELYGFLNFEELRLFEILDKISGIGPKTALFLSSFGSLENLKKAIERGDERLKKIGARKRKRLFLELSGKIKELKKEVEDEAFEGLLSLGFSKKIAKIALSKIPKRIKDPKEKIKEALRILGKR